MIRLARSGPAALLLMLVLLLWIYHDGLGYLVQMWGAKDEYSYGYIVPLIAAFLIWQRRDSLERMSFSGSWAGTAAVVLGLALFALGELSTLFIIVQYAFLIALAGAVLAYTGWRPMKILWVALAVLLFSIPLPDFLYIGLSQKLQMVSSQLGVGLIRLFGISVFLEGNVIDLGTYKLQVVEACSGLRYLFPLLTLGFLVTLFYRAPLWCRLLLIGATLPITIIMNSVRIGIVGLLVEYEGAGQAEGFLHYFEGWVIFMACLLMLFGLMIGMARLRGDRRPFRELLAIELPARRPAGAARGPQPAPSQAWVALALLAAAAIPASIIPQRAEAVPLRRDFSSFPLRIGAWSGVREALDRIYLDGLQLSDYILANYARDSRDVVNLYVSYYDSQRKGSAVHSPRVCLPGGGWVIDQFGPHEIRGVTIAGAPLYVNRAVISQGADHQLVYYWFQQRGRIVTDEYLVKWYLFWDALTRNRSDGSMVRLITPVSRQHPGGEDALLEDFARTVEPQLAQYLPD